MQIPEPNTRECPDCQATIPVHSGYVTWCDQCDWNLQPHQPDRPKNVFGSIYDSLGKRQGQALFDRLVERDSLKPSLTVTKILAFALAALVHGITLIFAVGGIVWLVRGWPGFWAIVGGLVCCGIAWVLRPRFAKLPDGVVPREELGTLYRLVDTVAESLDARRVSAIVIDHQFNAAFERVGWGRKSVLRLGLPLWVILDDREKVALIAHELAHGVNGDSGRGFFVGSAIDSLGHWYVMLRPEHLAPQELGAFGLAMVPANLVLLGLSALARLGAYILCHLIWQDSQRAEYMADHLESTVSGTDASLSLLRKQHFGQTVRMALRRAALGQDTDRDILQELGQIIKEVPKRELERIERVQRLEGSKLNVTHPPTVYRIKLLQAHRSPFPQVTFSLADLAQVEQELAAVRARVRKRLLGA